MIYIGILGLDRIAQRDGLCAAFEVSAGLARSLPDITPSGGYLARVGDDAFAILIEVASPPDARAIAKDLGQRITLPLGAQTGDADPHCKVGVAFAGPQDRSAAALLDRAFGDANPTTARHPPSHRSPGPSQEPTAQAIRPAPDPTERPETPAAPATTHPPSVDNAASTHASTASLATPAEVPPLSSPVPAAPRAPRRPKPPAAGEPSPLPDQAAMAGLVDQALDRSGAAELRLVFQPIVSLMGDTQENYSVLLRLSMREETCTRLKILSVRQWPKGASETSTAG